MHLQYLDPQWLISRAGGDPWAVNRMLQSGSPAQISSLAEAFHDAGQHGGDAEVAFNQARDRFDKAWNRSNGDHPINDAAEVQRATGTLGVQVAQLPKIALDLELLAASLAEAQLAAGQQISVLEGKLEEIDHHLAEVHAASVKGLILEGVRQDVIDDLQQEAVDETTRTLHDVERTRDQYSERLHDSMTKLRVDDGYDASALGGVDGCVLETPDQAEKDVQSALSGDIDAARRINAVLASINGEQVAGKAPLTVEQGSVLSQLQAQQHGMSVEALVTAEGRLGDQHAMIANSWQLMSNPAIVFPKTALKPGAKEGADTLKGGAGQLPESVQQVLDPLTPLDLIHAAKLRSVSDTVRHGDRAFQRNTEMDRGLLRRASAMMDNWFQLFDDAGEPRKTPPDSSYASTIIKTYDPAISNALLAISPDHQLVHDAVHDAVDEAMKDPKHDHFLRNIFHHSWIDHGAGVASLFNWTEGAAYGPEASIAADTARSYGTYIGSKAADLLRLPGNLTVGEANPDLVRGMAHGLKPYVSNIAGTASDVGSFGKPLDAQGGVDNGTMPIAKGIFSVLNSDREAGDYFNAGAYDHALLAEVAYAQEVIDHSGHTNSNNANLKNAATLRGLVDFGVHTAVAADAENRHLNHVAAQTAEYESKKSAYELHLREASGVAGLPPAVGKYAGPLVGILGAVIENDIVGQAPSALPLPTHVLPDMSIGAADRQILNTLVALGQRVDGVSQYMIEGRVAAPDELANLPGFTTGTYDQALNEALARVIAQSCGYDPRMPLVADTDMTLRYNAVIKDSEPPPKR